MGRWSVNRYPTVESSLLCIVPPFRSLILSSLSNFFLDFIYLFSLFCTLIQLSTFSDSLTIHSLERLVLKKRASFDCHWCVLSSSGLLKCSLENLLFWCIVLILFWKMKPNNTCALTELKILMFSFLHFFFYRHIDKVLGHCLRKSWRLIISFVYFIVVMKSILILI